MPDVIAVRNELLPEGDRERNLAFDLNNETWMRLIAAAVRSYLHPACFMYDLVREA